MLALRWWWWCSRGSAFRTGKGLRCWRSWCESKWVWATALPSGPCASRSGSEWRNPLSCDREGFHAQQESWGLDWLFPAAPFIPSALALFWPEVSEGSLLPESPCNLTSESAQELKEGTVPPRPLTLGTGRRRQVPLWATPLSIFSCWFSLSLNVLLLFVSPPVLCGGRGGVPVVALLLALQSQVLGSERLCTRPAAPPSWMEVGFSPVLRWNSNLLCWVQGLLWTSDPGLSTKEEVTPYHLDSTLFFPRILVGFLVTNSSINRVCALMIVIEMRTNIGWIILYFLSISIITELRMSKNKRIYLLDVRIKIFMMILLTFFLCPILQHYHPCFMQGDWWWLVCLWMGVASSPTFLAFYKVFH